MPHSFKLALHYAIAIGALVVFIHSAVLANSANDAHLKQTQASELKQSSIKEALNILRSIEANEIKGLK